METDCPAVQLREITVTTMDGGAPQVISNPIQCTNPPGHHGPHGSWRSETGTGRVVRDWHVPLVPS